LVGLFAENAKAAVVVALNPTYSTPSHVSILIKTDFKS